MNRVARAWFKLTHRDMGPKSRYLGPEVPEEDLIWQDPIPAVDHELIDDEDKVSLADLIVLAGCAGAEKAAKNAGQDVTVPFSPGRMDASQEQTDVEAIGSWQNACRLIGVPWQKAGMGGASLSYLKFADLPPEALSDRSRLLLTYALCGFANPGSAGIMIGGLSAMAPERRAEIVELGFKSLIGGTLATCMIGAVVGLL